MNHQRNRNRGDYGLVADILHRSLRWPPAGLIAAVVFALAGYVAKDTIRSEFGGSFAGEMVAIPLYLIAGFSFIFFLVGSVMWFVRRVTRAAAPPRPMSSDGPSRSAGLPSNAAAPVCVECGIPMVRRVAGRGVNAGRAFWGCRNFPNCRQVISIRS